MYFKLLFLFTIINFVRVIVAFVKEHPSIGNGGAVSTGAYISLGFSTVFHLMVLSICVIPTIL